jgi:geranylgeranyl diphosphate synthase, type II
MFEKYRARIALELEKEMAQMGEPSRLRDACEYALLSGGKRLRPIFVLMVADALGNGLDAMPVALSVEFFHTASLIADDLPCMDDDDERRNRPSLHRMFEESVALLASYTFIASGYEGIYKNHLRMKEDPVFGHKANEAVLHALEISTRCAGIRGATNGQFLDLFPPDNRLETIEKIIFQKTVTLFQISFVLGWVFGGGDPARCKEVEASAYHLGMAFQIADDIQDMSQDTSHACEINIATILGFEKARERFESELQLWKDSLVNLGIWNEDFAVAADFLQKLGVRVPTPNH